MHVVQSIPIRLGSGSIDSVYLMAGLLLPVTNSVVSSFTKLTNCFVFSLGDFVS